MYRKRNILGISIDDYWFDFEKYLKSDCWISIFHSNEKIGNENYFIKIKEKTFHIDLSNTHDEIFSKFKKKSARYQIKKAEKVGVIIKLAVTQDDKEDFRGFLKNFASQKGISKFEDDENLDNYDIFYALSPQGDYLGGGAFIYDNKNITYRYKYGATNHAYGENDLIIWEAIKYAKNEGFLIFDLGGVPDQKVVNKEGYNYGVYKFKEKFGGDLSNFYTYVKIKNILIPLFWILRKIVKYFFNNDFNSLLYFVGIFRKNNC